MRETDSNRRWEGLTNSISARLIGSLVAVMVVIFALLGYVNIRLHRQHLEAATLASAAIVRSVSPACSGLTGQYGRKRFRYS